MSVSVFKVVKILGLCLVLCLGCTQHDRLKMKAQMGNRRAMYEYGVDIWKHTSGRKDEVDEALGWIIKAAEKGEIEAIYEIGTIEEMGGGARPKAVYWFKKGAEAGHRPSMIKIANAYRYGLLGLEIDQAQADKWYGAAYRAGRTKGEHF